VYRTILLLALVFFSAASGAGAQRPHLDPLLDLLLQPEYRRSVEVALRAEPLRPLQRRPILGSLAFDLEGPQGSPRVGVFVKLRTPGALADLRELGAEVGTVVEEIATVRIPLAALEAVSELTSLERIEAAHVVRRANDLAATAVRAERVRSRVGGAWQGHTGQGVIAAIYDTGLDYFHQDFRDAADRTRLLGLWDQTRTGPPPTGFNFGYFCDVQSLNNRTCPQRDTDGHGTHVAGSAAADGGAAGEYAGIAPGADLLIVKGGDDAFREDWIIEGIDWVFQEAARRGRPAVVNLSLGGHFGPHDGTRLHEQAIDALSGPGRIVVVAAGNEGANTSANDQGRPLIHAMGTPVAGVTERFTIVVPAYEPDPGTSENTLAITFWYSGADQLAITVVRPDGSRVTAPFGQITQDLAATGGVRISNAAAGPNPENNDHHALIVFDNLPGSGPPARGTWAIEVAPEALGAAAPAQFLSYENDIGGRGVEGFTNSHTVGSPGTAVRAITVGAFVTRLRWTSTDGNTYGFVGPDEEIGDVAQFSSTGPTRDNRVKPEITAPGRVIISALSSFATVQRALIVPTDQHFASQGTSMAAPMVTGGIALLLQRAPALTPEHIKQIFAATATRDAFTQRSYTTGDPGGTPNFTWGWGKLNVETGIEAAAEFAQVSVLAVDVDPIEPPPAVSTERGTLIPVLRLTLTADGPEALDVTQLGFAALGADPGARLVLIRDLQRDGQIGPQDPVLATQPAPLEPDDTTRVSVPLALRIPAGQSVGLIAAIEMSGAAPHLAPLRAWFLPEETRAVGVETGATSPLRQPLEVVPSPELRPTLLAPDELFALSENPVRSPELILNFRSRPSLAQVYTASGRRVIDLMHLLEDDSRIAWDLTNQQGTPVAAGVYLLVFRIDDVTIRERLIISRPAGGG
jgi:subtilisin family serine protease